MEKVYLCPKCFEAQSMPGICPHDGTELLSCRPGDPDDPCRRPLMNRQGKVLRREAGPALASFRWVAGPPNLSSPIPAHTGILGQCPPLIAQEWRLRFLGRRLFE